MRNYGRLIVFEGLSGSGKGTQLARLSTALYSRGCNVLMTREPTEGQFGRQVKELRSKHKLAGVSTSEAREDYLRLYTLDAKDHCENLIVPALRQEVTVLCDRYYHSRLCYQVEEGVDLQKVLQLQREAEIVAPDLTVIFDLDPQLALQRIDSRGKRSQLEQLDFMTHLRHRYLQLPSLLPDEEIRVVDASQDVDLVSEQVMEIVSAFIVSD